MADNAQATNNTSNSEAVQSAPAQSGSATILAGSQQQTQQSSEQTSQSTQSTNVEGSTNANTAPSFSLYEKDGTLSKAFIEAFPEADREAWTKIASKYKDPANLVKGLTNLNWAASQKGFERPADDAPQNVKDAFNARMRTLRGVPENPDGYDLKAPEGLPSGLSWNEADAKEWATFAHQQGLGKEEVAKLTEYQMAREAKRAEAYFKEQDAALTAAFGDKRSDRLKAASSVAAKFGVDVNNPAIGNNAEVIKMLATIHDKIGESNFISNGAAAQASTGDLQTQMSDIGRKALEAQASGRTDEYNRLVQQQTDLARRVVASQKKPV